MSNNDNSNSPFEIFRRNLKPLMVLLTILALFSFVVLPVVQTAMNQGGGGGGNEVIAKFGGMDVTRNRVEYFTRNHGQAIRFLQEIGQETIDRGGQPKVAGFRQNPQSGDIESTGIPMTPSPELTVRTLAYATAAREDGFDLDDASLSRWLESYTDNQFSPRDIDAKLMQSSGNQMARQHLFEQLRNHLLAGIYNRRGGATLISSRGREIKTPLQQWEAFLKLRRSATITAYGVLVDDFISQTNASPSPTQIEEVYQDGKDRDANEQSPLPAFHQRESATMQSLVGDYEKFISEEVEKISQSQLRAEYERRRTGGDFQLPTQDEMELREDTEIMIDGSEDIAAEAEMTAEESEEAEADSSETTDPSMVEEVDDDQAADANAKSDSSDPEQPASTDQPETSLNSPETEPAESDQSGLSSTVATTLVAMMQEETTASDEDAASDDDAATDDDAMTEDEAATEDEAVTDDDAVTEEADAQEGDGEEESEGMKSNEMEAEDSDSDDDGPQYRTFEEVQNEIARDLARPKAEERWTAASNEINSTMRRYFTDYAIWEGNSKGDSENAGEAPKRPDMKALADKLGFEVIEIGPHDILSIDDEDINDSFGLGGPNRVRGFQFRFEMFGIPSQGTPGQPLFSPLRTIDDQTGKIYVTWKISETEARTPTLEEVRDDVINYIRRQEAKELAKAEAEKFVQQINQTEADLVSLVPDDKEANYYEELGPFEYLAMVGRFQISIGNVEQLDSVGEDFMKAVFDTDVGNAAMALNQPERAVYVVVPTKFDPSIDELKQQFREPINRQMASMVASGTGDIQNGFVKNIELKTGLEELFE